MIAFCVAVGFGVLVPVLPVFARTFGVGNVAVGAVISMFALMRLVASPLCGRLIAWAGERTILATGIFIVAASSGLAGIAQSYAQLLVLRGVGGVGSAMFTVSAMTLLLGSVDPGRRGRAMGVFQGGFLLGGMTGPAVGGLLALISIDRPVLLLRRHPGGGRSGGAAAAESWPLGRSGRRPAGGPALPRGGLGIPVSRPPA